MADAKEPSDMKVVELRVELKKRGLSTAGVKADLVQRLSDALNGKESKPNKRKLEEKDANTKKKQKGKRKLEEKDGNTKKKQKGKRKKQESDKEDTEVSETLPQKEEEEEEEKEENKSVESAPTVTENKESQRNGVEPKRQSDTTSEDKMDIEELSKPRKDEKEPSKDGKKFNLADSPSKTHKNSEKKVYPYGNYGRYYGYRTEKGETDPRLTALRREWFFSKKCLDIGCNVGKLTFELTAKFRPTSMKGIDIDESLIKEADKTLQYKKEKKQKKKQELKAFPLSFKMVLGPLPEQENPFPDNLSFVAGNYLEYEDDEKYDCITCFSTSKWIHLNWGDEGIKMLFQKVYDHLNEGGVFIFEPQLWNSYKKKSSLTENIKKNYKAIKLFPDQFADYLTKEMKFTLERTLKLPPEKKNSGFDRPILLLRK